MEKERTEFLAYTQEYYANAGEDYEHLNANVVRFLTVRLLILNHQYSLFTTYYHCLAFVKWLGKQRDSIRSILYKADRD